MLDLMGSGLCSPRRRLHPPNSSNLCQSNKQQAVSSRFKFFIQQTYWPPGQLRMEVEDAKVRGHFAGV